MNTIAKDVPNGSKCRTKPSNAGLEEAIAIAASAHKGQVDKGGSPYILHPLRLMMRMTSPEAQIAAVLHDVVEDTDWTIEQLREEGFSEVVIEAVEALTERAGEDYGHFVDRASSNQIARRIKIADIEDNMNLLRIDELRPKDLARLERYHIHWRRLQKLNQEDQAHDNAH